MTTMADPKTLDWREPLKVSYCVPLWLRDEQIKANIAAVPGRIAPIAERQTHPVAVVCYGPSLAETWEQARDFETIISCSGAHKFLLERGIVPTYHVEVDPRAHKIELLGPPDPRVTYLIASTCHPSYIAHLQQAGVTVQLWHVFDTAEEGKRILPPGEWAITGGASVGLRALGIARFLGFTDLHVFGMDGCEGKTGKHAAAHPNQASGHQTVEYEGVTYKTTTAILECARQTWHELDQLGPGVTATFHGEGLVQAMAKQYTPKPVSLEQVQIAIRKPELISAAYRDLNAELHRTNLAYGVGGGKHADTVVKLADSIKARAILDYGCGKGYLGKELAARGIAIWEYDPAIPGKDASAYPADLVICSDVLEHIEPDRLAFVLDDLRRVTKQVAYLVIHTGPASKTLPDGRNTHLIQQGKEWWRETLAQVFTIGSIIQKGPELHVIVGPKKAKKAKVA